MLAAPFRRRRSPHLRFGGVRDLRHDVKGPALVAPCGAKTERKHGASTGQLPLTACGSRVGHPTKITLKPKPITSRDKGFIIPPENQPVFALLSALYRRPAISAPFDDHAEDVDG